MTYMNKNTSRQKQHPYLQMDCTTWSGNISVYYYIVQVIFIPPTHVSAKIPEKCMLLLQQTMVNEREKKMKTLS